MVHSSYSNMTRMATDYQHTGISRMSMMLKVLYTPDPFSGNCDDVNMPYQVLGLRTFLHS